MRVDFGEEGYVEISRSNKLHHVCIVVASRQPNNPLELIVNIAEVHQKQFMELISDAIGPQMLPVKKEVEENGGDN